MRCVLAAQQGGREEEEEEEEAEEGGEDEEWEEAGVEGWKQGRNKKRAPRPSPEEMQVRVSGWVGVGVDL